MAMDSSDFSRIIQSTALVSMISRKTKETRSQLDYSVFVIGRQIAIVQQCKVKLLKQDHDQIK